MIWGLLLTRKLLNQGFLIVIWKSSLQKFYDTTMTFTVTEYMCHKLPWIYSFYRNHYPVLSSWKTYHDVCNKGNMTGGASGAGAAYSVGAPEFNLFFSSAVHAVLSLDFCVVFCRLLLVLVCHMVIVLSILLWLTTSNYPFWYLQTFLIHLDSPLYLFVGTVLHIVLVICVAFFVLCVFALLLLSNFACVSWLSIVDCPFGFL